MAPQGIWPNGNVTSPPSPSFANNVLDLIGAQGRSLRQFSGAIMPNDVITPHRVLFMPTGFLPLLHEKNSHPGAGTGNNANHRRSSTII